MSRIGKKPITIPAGVDVQISGDTLQIKGPKGSLERVLHPVIQIAKEGDTIVVSLKEKAPATQLNPRALWGLSRALVQNMVQGVTAGYEKRLEIEGVGYRANMEGNTLSLQVGFSHLVKLPVPQGLECKIEKNTVIVSGISKADVGQFAARIRQVRKVEPYKGKGIRYAGEVVRKKLGKKAATATAGKA